MNVVAFSLFWTSIPYVMRHRYWLPPLWWCPNYTIQYGMHWRHSQPGVPEHYSINSLNSVDGGISTESDDKYAEPTTTPFWSLPSPYLTFVVATHQPCKFHENWFKTGTCCSGRATCAGIGARAISFFHDRRGSNFSWNKNRKILFPACSTFHCFSVLFKNLAPGWPCAHILQPVLLLQKTLMEKTCPFSFKDRQSSLGVKGIFWNLREF